MQVWGKNYIWENGRREEGVDTHVYSLRDEGTEHLAVHTKSCGVFFVPVSNLTLHDLDGQYRVLFRDDPEWREVEKEEYMILMEML